MDSALLEQAVRGLNAVMTRKGLDRALALASRILDDMFRGEPALYRERSRRHATYHAVLAHPETPVSRRDVWTAVRVYDQVAELPSELARGLSYTHHRLLLGVSNPEEKRALARDVLRGDLSKRDLERRLAQVAVPGDPRPGRPRAPQWLKGLQRVREGVAVAADPVALEQAMGLLDVPQLSEVVHELDAQIRALEELRADLHERLDSATRPTG